MFVERFEFTSPRTACRWAVFAAVGSLSTAVLLSGLGLAADDEKKPVKPAEPVPTDPVKGEKPRDGDKPREPQKGDKPREVVTIEEVDELKRKIIAAAAMGNVEALRKLSEELARMMAKQKIDPFVNPRDLPDVAKLKQAMVERLRAFELDIEKLKGAAEAQEAMRRAMDEYRKAIEQSLNAQTLRGDAQKAVGRAEDLLRREVLGKPNAGREGAGRLGVSLATVPEALVDQLDLAKGRCLLVTGVAPGSVAEKAGLRKNDVLVSFAGQEVAADSTRFAEQVAALKAGEKFDIVVLRKGKKVEIKGMELAEVKRERVEIEVNRGPRVEFEQMQVQVTPDSFHIDAAKGDLKYAIEGKRDGGKSAPTSIAIATGKAKNVYKSLSEVPEEHRPAVQQLLGSIR